MPAPPHSPAFVRLRRGKPAQAVRHIPLLTEIETLFDFGCYNYAAPDGAPAGRALLPQRLFDLGDGAPSPYRNQIYRRTARPKRQRTGALQDASRQPDVIVNAPASWTAVALHRF